MNSDAKNYLAKKFSKQKNFAPKNLEKKFDA